MTDPSAPAPAAASVARLSTLDRLLPLWIGVAMATGLVLGRLVPGLGSALGAVEVDGVSLPIALGLLVMMYPVLAKVRYDRLDTVTSDRRMLVGSLVLNWLVGPAVMFTLAWLLLADLPDYRTGIIIVGLARCIAMVIIWNDLACGDREAAAVLVALNSIFQVLAFAGLGWFYLSVLPGWLGLPGAALDVSAAQIARSVLVFLGIPLLAGYLSRRIGEKRWGRAAYEAGFLPRIGPRALYGLLFTVVVLFALQGDQITTRPWDVARIALPLLAAWPLSKPSTTPPPATGARGMAVVEEALGKGAPIPTYHALVIGINDYQHWPSLRQARPDAARYLRRDRGHIHHDRPRPRTLDHAVRTEANGLNVR